MTKKKLLLLMLITALIAIPAGLFFYQIVEFILTPVKMLNDSAYRSRVKEIFAKKVVAIEFKPQVNREFVKVTEPDDIEKIKNCLCGAKTADMGIGTYLPTSCPLKIIFDDNTRIEMMISLTGITETNFFGQDENSTMPRCIRISFEKFHAVVAQNQPFTDILKRKGLFVSPTQDPNRPTIEHLRK